ncbi:MAG TPA: hypothetical protein VFK69_00745, partial [Candidatus Eisenbacteria bacterium]|nr:hypothetical protein [Candidatus Eisenbacteria bacterium]
IVLLSAVTIARVPGRGTTPIPAPPAAAERGLSPSQSLLARSGVPASLWSDAGSSDPGELLQGAR